MIPLVVQPPSVSVSITGHPLDPPMPSLSMPRLQRWVDRQIAALVLGALKVGGNARDRRRARRRWRRMVSQ